MFIVELEGEKLFILSAPHFGILALIARARLVAVRTDYMSGNMTARMSKLSSYFPLLVVPYSIILLLAHYKISFYPFELLVSFAHYLFFANIVVLIILIILRKHRFFIFSFVTLFVTTILVGSWVHEYSSVGPPEGTGSKEMTLAFLNKNYANRNYEALNLYIQNIDPDIFGLAEIRENDVTDDIPVLKEYPHSHTKAIRDDVFLALFSKYPLKIRDVGDLQNVLAADVLIDSKTYTVLTIHPFPPATPWELERRNEELMRLSTYVKGLDRLKVILLGDFNTSPWSYTFRQLTESLHAAGLKDVSKGQGLHLTWGFLFLRTQIDYIFVPERFLVEEFSSWNIEGSDHRLIWTNILY